MTASEIIGRCAASRLAERVTERMSGHRLSPTEEDLCQMVYLRLLERCPEETLRKAWERGEMEGVFVRYIHNERRLVRSEWNRTFAAWERRCAGEPSPSIPDEG